MLQQGLTPTEITRLEAALAVDGIRVGWLHRWCWRRGVRLPPAALMSLLPFLLWQVLTFFVTTLPWLVIGLQTWRMPTDIRTASAIILTIAVIIFIGRLLFLAAKHHSIGGVAWIEKLAVAGLIAIIWTFLTVVYVKHGDAMSAPDPLFIWIFFGSFFAARTVALLGSRNSRRQEHRESWRDYWQGRTQLEAF